MTLADIILIDPPWNFKVWSKETGSAKSPKYDVMSNADIKALDIASVADKNCALFMWTTYPFLDFAIECGKAWGFKYKTVAFIWAKLNKSFSKGRFVESVETDANWFCGTGHWTRANTEPVLLFTRGKISRVSMSVRQLVVKPLLPKHSEKPIEVHHRIEQLVGTEHTFLEVFARRCPERFSHWTFLGNEVTGNDIRDDLKAYAEKE